MQTRFNQSWYGKRAKVIRDNKDYCVMDAKEKELYQIIICLTEFHAVF